MGREIPAYCKLLNHSVLESMDEKAGDHGTLRDFITTISKDCGYEKINNNWIEFPKRKGALEKVCGKLSSLKCDILETHGDGDLTVQTEDNVFVITTDGKVFREIQQEPVR